MLILAAKVVKKWQCCGRNREVWWVSGADGGVACVIGAASAPKCCTKDRAPSEFWMLRPLTQISIYAMTCGLIPIEHYVAWMEVRTLGEISKMDSK